MHAVCINSQKIVSLKPRIKHLETKESQFVMYMLIDLILCIEVLVYIVEYRLITIHLSNNRYFRFLICFARLEHLAIRREYQEMEP